MWSLCWYDKCIEILPNWSIVVQLFTALLQYSFMSLENSERLFSGNLDGVSYSIILPAHHKKTVFTLVNKEVISNNMWGIHCICVITDVLFTVVEDKNGITIDDCQFHVLLSTPYSPSKIISHQGI
jgi:hypothetical protein